MIDKLLDKLKSISPWHFIWVSVIFSELITFFVSSLLGRLWWVEVSRETLIVGAIDSLIAPMIVATLVIFFVKRATELKKINDELQEANRKLQELDRLKSDFITIVSHELRTPLTTVKAFAELVVMKPDMSDDRKMKIMACINSETDRLTRLVSDILDLARIEAGSMRWQKQTLFIEEVIEQTTASLEPLFDNKALTVGMSFESPWLPVYADRDRMAQVVTNVLSNAAKYSDPGGTVHIDVRGEGSGVSVSITDTGAGIPPAELEIIFEKFRRSGKEQLSTTEGTGLGLAIAREIIEHHGGRIWATTAEGGGSIFTFTLPLAAGPRDQPA